MRTLPAVCVSLCLIGGWSTAANAQFVPELPPPRPTEAAPGAVEASPVPPAPDLLPETDASPEHLPVQEPLAVPEPAPQEALAPEVPADAPNVYSTPMQPPLWSPPLSYPPPVTGGVHLRYPYYSYRRPWYTPGPASVNVTIVW